MENVAQKFKDLAEKYGFKIIQDGDTLSLCAKNTDDRWTRWIKYNPGKHEVSLCGETDYLNIWLGETRPDMTPEKCVSFVDELNNLFEFFDTDKILVRDLIDPEDWQEIAGIPDASEDIRFGKLIEIGIDGNYCIQVDEWIADNNTYVLGLNLADRSFFHALVNGQDHFEYDEGPTRERIESDYASVVAQREFDRYEAEFGADGRRAFPNLNDDIEDKTQAQERTFTITNFLGEKIELALSVGLYTVEDFMGESLPGLAIVMDQVNTENGEKEPCGLLTVSFGEFISLKNCAYIDTNNCPFAEQLLEQGIAQPTGYHKESGFCSYPLWQFNEDFLKSAGAENYHEYSEAYDKYMGMFQDNENWELVSRKEVPDADGFMTEYSWYTDGDVHIFIFGDSEVYYPESTEPDWECETEEEAREWFENYNGFAPEEELDELTTDFEENFEDLSEDLSCDETFQITNGGKFGLTEERYNQMMKSCNNDEEWVESIVLDWGAENCNKGYAIFHYEGTELLELCAINDVDAFTYDAQAAAEAKNEGINIIPQDELPEAMPFGMQYHQWIDTAENRENIAAYCEKMRERATPSSSLNDRIVSAQERKNSDNTPLEKNEKDPER